MQHVDRNADWNQFLDWLSGIDINESDKSAWESSTNEVDGLIFIISLLCRINFNKDEKLLQRALADYINPPVQINGNRVFFAPWRIASGTYLTAYGNTERHRSMNFWMADFLETHGSYGNDNCVCTVCQHFGSGPTVTAFEIALIRNVCNGRRLYSSVQALQPFQ